MSLLRKPLALIPLALVLSRQPFVMRPRQSGVNALKFRPLDAALMGMVHWGLESPTAMRNPSVKRYINETGRVLLTPYEYFAAQQSKRAMPAEKMPEELPLASPPGSAVSTPTASPRSSIVKEMHD